MKLAVALILSLAASGCVLVYANKADRLALQMHDQAADYMPIEQRIEPKVSDEVIGAVGIKAAGLRSKD